eukprot:2391853-Rhodomonas_salina.5
MDFNVPPNKRPSSPSSDPTSPLKGQMQFLPPAVEQNVPYTQHAINCWLLKLMQNTIHGCNGPVQQAVPPPHLPNLPFASCFSSAPFPMPYVPPLKPPSPRDRHAGKATSHPAADKRIELYPRKKQGQTTQPVVVLDKPTLSALYHLPLKEAAK